MFIKFINFFLGERNKSLPFYIHFAQVLSCFLNEASSFELLHTFYQS